MIKISGTKVKDIKVSTDAGNSYSSVNIVKTSDGKYVYAKPITWTVTADNSSIDDVSNSPAIEMCYYLSVDPADTTTEILVDRAAGAVVSQSATVDGYYGQQPYLIDAETISVESTKWANKSKPTYYTFRSSTSDIYSTPIGIFVVPTAARVTVYTQASPIFSNYGLQDNYASSSTTRDCYCTIYYQQRSSSTQFEYSLAASKSKALALSTGNISYITITCYSQKVTNNYAWKITPSNTVVSDSNKSFSATVNKTVTEQTYTQAVSAVTLKIPYFTDPVVVNYLSGEYYAKITNNNSFDVTCYYSWLNSSGGTLSSGSFKLSAGKFSSVLNPYTSDKTFSCYFKPYDSSIYQSSSFTVTATISGNEDETTTTT